jgi:hypothetical protein
MAYLRPTVRQLQPLGRRNPHLGLTARGRVQAGPPTKQDPAAPRPTGGVRHLR